MIYQLTTKGKKMFPDAQKMSVTEFHGGMSFLRIVISRSDAGGSDKHIVLAEGPSEIRDLLFLGLIYDTEAPKFPK